MQQLVRRWSCPRGRKLDRRLMQEHRAGKDQRKGSNGVRTRARRGWISFGLLQHTYLHNFPSSVRIHPEGMDFCSGTYFFPSADVRLERELIYDSQFDERPRGRKKRSFFSENEHQRLGEKRKWEREREVGKRKSDVTTSCGSKSTASTRGDKIARGFSMEDDIDDTRFYGM